jgi:hypothetical protein
LALYAVLTHSAAASIGDYHRYELASDKASPETSKEPNSVDGGPIYSMYLKKAEKEDKRTAKGWKEEAEQVFLFVSV